MTAPSRRMFLAQAAGLGGTLFAAPVAELLAVHDHIRQALARGPYVFKTLTPAQAVEVAAMAAEIIPSDDSPGATEAHVACFIDHMLSMPDSVEERRQYPPGLAMLQARTNELYPDVALFSVLDGEARRRVLTAIETTPFFGLVRGQTIAGFLTDPKYDGNAGQVGWKHIGFTPAFAYQPPFGDYDAEDAGKGEPR